MANRNAGTISIRLAVKDGKLIERGLKKMGRQGQQALGRIQDASKPASKGLLAVNAASGQLKEGIHGLSGRLGGFGRALGSIGPIGVGVAAGIAGVVLGLNAMRKAGVNAAKGLAEIRDEALVAGLGIEAFQEFQFVALKTGISTDALVDGFKELQLRTQEFAERGVGTAKDIFVKLGYSQDQLTKKLKDTPAFFDEIISKIRELDKAQQILALDELFGGTAGEQFQRLMADNISSIDDMRQSARSLGFVIDEAIINKGNEASKQLEIMAQIIDRNLDQALVDLAPLAIVVSEAFVVLSGTIRDFADASRDLGEKSGSGLKTALDDNIAQIAKIDRQLVALRVNAQNAPLPIAKQSIEYEIADFERRRAALVKLQGKIESEVTTRSATTPVAAKNTGTQAALQKQLDIRKSYLDTLKRMHLSATNERVKLIEFERDRQLEALEKQKLGTEQSAQARSLIIETANARIIAVQEKTAKSQGKLTDAQKDGARLMKELQTASQTYAVRLEDLNGLLQSGAIDQQTYTRAIVEAEKVFLAAEQSKLAQSRLAADGMKRALLSYTDEALNSASSVETLTNNMFSNMEDALVGFVTTGKFEMSSFIDGILADFARLTVRQSISGPLAQFASSFIGSIFGGGGPLNLSAGVRHSGGMVGGNGPVRSVSAKLFENAPRFHNGGMVGLKNGERPIIAMEDERVLTQAQQGNIADALRGLGSMATRSSTPNINISVHNYGGETVQAETDVQPDGQGGFNVGIFIEQVEGRIAQNVARGHGPLYTSTKNKFGLNPANGVR